MGRDAVIVLDTCAIIWDALNADRLTTKAKQTIKAAEADNELVISDISIIENNYRAAHFFRNSRTLRELWAGNQQRPSG